MELIILTVIVGIGFLVFGIIQKKTEYDAPHYCEAEIVGYKKEYGSSPLVLAVNLATEMVKPVVRVALENGQFAEIPVHTSMMKQSIEAQFPELRIGNSVDIIYYGKRPKEAFLANHPLGIGFKPLSFSIWTAVGVAVLAVAAMLLYTYITW